jgi:hypothetical protein
VQLRSLQFANGRWSAPLLTDLDSEQTLVLAFGSPSFYDRPEPFTDLRQHFPRSHLVGCSTSGEILGAKVHDESISVAVARFEHATVRHVTIPIDSGDSFGAGQRLARELDGDALSGVLVLSDGLVVNGSELVRGINAVLPESVVVTGGLAGDGDRFERTWVLDGSTPVRGHVSAVGLSSPSRRLRIGHGSKGGWDIFGPERVVTRAVGNVLYELDGKPALQLYKNYLGHRASGLPATALLFPLALRVARDDPKSLVRTVLAVDDAKQSMTFAGDVPVGALAQLMMANFDRLVQGASEAGAMATDASAVEDVLSIAISCVGRRLVLGERTDEEIEAVKDNLPSHAQQVGFYSYGEISPYATGRCDLHNQTMTVTTIREV